jgi:hypothetical protein
MSEAQVQELVDYALDDGSKVETLSHHGNLVSSKKIIRCWREPSAPVIVKVWQHYKLRHRVRQWLQISSAQCEIRNLAAMAALGIGVPAPLGFAHLRAGESQFQEAVVMEDLGRCTTGTDHLRVLIASGRDDALQAFEHKIISMATALIQGGVVDRDFTIDNIVICEGGIRRIDVEIARRVRFPSVSRYFSGDMFGALLATYTWAVYPQVDLVPRFMTKLKRTLALPRSSWRRTEHVYNATMKKYGSEHGGLTQLQLPWSSA